MGGRGEGDKEHKEDLIKGDSGRDKQRKKEWEREEGGKGK